MSSHLHPPGTPTPGEREVFLVDGCERCVEYVEDLGTSFDAERFRAFWRKMVEVEYDYVGGYRSKLDKRLGRRLYWISLSLQRAFGLDPRELQDKRIELLTGLLTEIQVEEINGRLCARPETHKDRCCPVCRDLWRRIDAALAVEEEGERA